MPIKASNLAKLVKAIGDPQGRGRQYLAAFLSGLAGMRAAGFVLTRQEPKSFGKVSETSEEKPASF